MANPPPVRPWFRLASIRSTQPPPPAPAPSQEPRTTMVLPAFRTASAPPSPQEPSSQPNRFFSSSSSSSLPTSPVHKATTLATSSPTHSPNNKNNESKTPPPSPLTLPPSQLIPEHAEPKTVLVHETIDRPKPKPRNNNESKSKEKGVERKVNSESDMRVITIAGENRGAYMELKKHEPKYLVQNKKDEVVDSEEVNVNKKDHKGTFPMSAYMNSNVQCVNNSLLYHTCCSHHDPGVRLSLSNKPFALEEHHN